VSARVRFEAEADAEYRSAGRWYEEQRPGLGTEFLDAVDAAIDFAIGFPRAGTPVPGVPVGLAVRTVPVRRFPYRVVYLLTESSVRILAVAHDRRRPGYWTDRLRKP